MTLSELNRLIAQGFTAADLRALGLIPSGGTEIPKDGDRKEPLPGPIEPQPHGREEINIPDPHVVPVPVEPPKPVTPQEMSDRNAAALAALTAKLDSLTNMFQASARSGVNTGGPARIIDPMDTGAESLARLSGYTTNINGGEK